ncbi:MAG: hypothetical protein QM569_16115 [Acidovorax sp.]|uniref:hypothetical protein n=1 Tax=Acidovorax sp. TaxID=1872122 RepID=UPI0039E4D4A5
MQKIHSHYTVPLAGIADELDDLVQIVQHQPVAVLVRDQAVFYLVGEAFLADDAPQSDTPAAPTFAEAAEKLVLVEADRVKRGAFSLGSLQILKNRLKAHILPVMGHVRVDRVQADQMQTFMERMSALSASSTTISQYLVIIRKVLKLAVSRQWMRELPEIPRIPITSQPRSTFTVGQYRALLRTAKRLAHERAEAPRIKESPGTRKRFWITPRHRQLPLDMYWLIGFMVNSFVRPSDIRTLRHRHVEIVRRDHLSYLRLTLPTTKKHDKPIVTLQPAVRIYGQLVQARARAVQPDDYLFLPAEKDRSHALAVLNFWLQWVLREAGIPRIDVHGQARTLYCLRHTAITFRLLYGEGIDMLTLARNARTSVAMIESFYASSLTGEMNVGMLQSRRTSRSR